MKVIVVNGTQMKTVQEIVKEEELKLLPPPEKKSPKFCFVDTQDKFACVGITVLMNELGWEKVNDYRLANAVVFPGGADVDPTLYGEKRHITTTCMPRMDHKWKSVYGHVHNPRWMKIGICRGAQFLCVLNGGKLWQDVDGHLGKHEAFYTARNGDRLIFDVTSTHHQMMRPSGTWAELWAGAYQSSYRDSGTDLKCPVNRLMGPDPEVLYYPNTHTLCFQPHPEYGVDSCKKLFKLCLDRAIARQVGQGGAVWPNEFQPTNI